jgi:hypothetical protein
MDGLTKTQRFLTIDFITKRRLNAPAIWLKPESGVSSSEDALRVPEKLETNIGDWILAEDTRNAGVRLVDGYVELKVNSPDDVWITELFNAFGSLKVDARASFGLEGKPISSIIFRVENPDKIDRWSDRWPRGYKDKAGNWVQTELVYSLPPTAKTRPVWRDSSPLPGSKFGNAPIVWRPLGKPATDNNEIGLEDLEPRALGATDVASICRAIAFATLAYWIHSYLDGLTVWEESLARALGGWIARLVVEGHDINSRGKSLEGVCWSPIEDAFTAGELITFLIDKVNAPKDLGSIFTYSMDGLERNAPVAGWGSIETFFGIQAKIGIRRAFRAGIDIDLIERMSERYLLDTSEHVYLDREELLKGNSYQHKHEDLIRLWENEPVFINNKPLNPFKLYSASQLRTDVSRQDFFPGAEPGAIVRVSPVYGLLKGEERQPDDYRVLNIFSGFKIKPIGTPDPTIMRKAVGMLDRMLGLLTRNNNEQMLWLKKFVAWIVQHPEIKPQVCPIIVGGQGIGKSAFGDNLMRAMFGVMAGSADASALTENKFLITPFVGKLITFIDEVKLESRGSINSIKKLVRSEHVSGQVKFGHQKDYYIPSRLLIASNQPDIGLTPDDAADRCFFFIMSSTAENKRMTEREFQTWALSLKPFYAEFIIALESVSVRQHLMRHFFDTEVVRTELEDLKYSSRDDENVVKATLSKSRDLARRIISDARVVHGLDITAWFNRTHVREAIKRHEGSRAKVEPGDIISEFEHAGLTERMPGDMMRFKWGYGRLLEKASEAHALKLEGMWPTQPGQDWEDNKVVSADGASPWRGFKQKQRPIEPERDSGEENDPDYLDPF